jgi:hypothetical protein
MLAICYLLVMIKISVVLFCLFRVLHSPYTLEWFKLILRVGRMVGFLVQSAIHPIVRPAQ